MPETGYNGRTMGLQQAIDDRHRLRFESARHPLLGPDHSERAHWSDGDLDHAFVDALIAAGSTTYIDGRPAALGAYASVLDYSALAKVCDCFTAAELARIVAIYRDCHYLSPIFGLLASWTELIIARRNAQDPTSAGADPEPRAA